MGRLLWALTVAMVVVATLPASGQRPTNPQPTINPGSATGVRTDTTQRPKKTVKPAPAGVRGSRIVDDSTKNVYGPHTTRWTTEADLFINRPNYRPLDTAIHNLHRWNYFQRLNNFYQDLGNNGTALNSIFPDFFGETIGVSSGFIAYQPYYDTEVPVLYNTKSPYTRMALIWGGKGRATTRAEYTRNINPRWNFGFNYRPLLTNRQIQRRGKSDYQVVSHYYDAYTHFQSKDSAYSAVAMYRRIRHRSVEMGEVLPTVTGVDVDTLSFAQAYRYYFRDNARPALTVANSLEQRNNLHLFHQYNLMGQKVQAYHVVDRLKQINWFRDDLSQEQEPFYDEQRLDTAANSPTKFIDSTRFITLQNQLGVKGSVGKVFYNAYGKIRSYQLWHKYLNTDTIPALRPNDEWYAGGQLGYFIDSTGFVSVTAETLQGGYSRLQAQGTTRWGDFRVQRKVSKPSFLHTTYSGHFDFWNNQFKPIETTQVAVLPRLTWKGLMVSPGVNYGHVMHQVYFVQRDTFPGTDQRVMPVQTEKLAEWITPEVRLAVRLPWNFHVRTQALYTRLLTDRDSIIQVPQVFLNGQLTYENEWFKKNLQVQIGVDAHWRSAYKAMGYDPAIQSYYVQNSLTVPAYPIVDIFFNAKMKRGRFFVKYHNLLQAITGIEDANMPVPGHMPTPYFPGQRNILDFGFDILLFD